MAFCSAIALASENTKIDIKISHNIKVSKPNLITGKRIKKAKIKSRIIKYILMEFCLDSKLIFKSSLLLKNLLKLLML